MKHLASAVIAAALIAAASMAAALPMGPACCACVPAGGAQTSGFTNRTTVSALFCAQAPPADPDQLADQCQMENWSYKLFCAPGIPGTSCVAELADAGIGCPHAGVPAATGSTALALAVTLGAAGALLLRHRRRTDS